MRYLQQVFLMVFLLCITSCNWEELPTNKTLKQCQKPTLEMPSQVGSNRLEFSVALSNTQDVSQVTWNISGPSANPTVTQNNTAGYRATVAVGGTYTLTATYRTTCGETGELRTTYTSAGCQRPNDKLLFSPNNEDPTKTTFTLEGNTSDISTVSWRNGTTTINDKNASTPFILDFDFQRGQTYNISASFSDKCGNSGTASSDPYAPKSCAVPSNIRAIPAGSGLSIPLAFDGATTDLSSTKWTVTDVTNNSIVFDQSYSTSPFAPSSSVTLPLEDRKYRIEVQYSDKCGGTNLRLGAVEYTTPTSGITSNGSFSGWRAGGAGDDRGNAIDTDRFGNVYVVGNYGGAIDFGNGSISPAGSNDVFIAKYNSTGGFSWVQRVVGNGNDEGKSIVIDPANGDVYVTGQVSAGGRVFPTPTDARNSTNAQSFNNVANDVFVVKYNTDGTLIWRQVFSGNNAAQGLSIDLHSSGVYVAGTFTFPFINIGSIRVSAPNGEASKQEGFLTKLNTSNGTPIWAVGIGGYENDFISGVSVDPDGVAYLTGSIASPATFRSASGASSTQSSNANPDIFIAKYSSVGNFMAFHAANSGNNSFGTNIKVKGESVYVSGLMNGTRYGSLTVPNRGSTDTFVGKYAKESLAVQWVQTAGSSGGDGANGIDVDDQGNIYLTGYYSDNATFGTLSSIRSVGQGDIFVASYGTNGNFKWVKTTGSTGPDGAVFIRLNDSQTVLYFTGFYGAAVNFPPAFLFSGGTFDFFVGKFP